MAVLKLVIRRQTLIRQEVELIRLLSFDSSLNHRSDSSRDLALHIRDSHRGGFNLDMDRQFRDERKAETTDLYTQLGAIREAIEEIEGQLEEAGFDLGRLDLKKPDAEGVLA